MCFLFPLIWYGTTALAAQAESQHQDPWYQVSLVIFKHKNSPLGNEKWAPPETLALSFPSGIVELETVESPNNMERIAFQASEPLDEEFKQALASIKLSSNYEVLTTKTWQQPALDKDVTIPVLIQAGNEYDGYHELEGSVTLAVSRYLHLKADLWLADYIQQVEMITPWWQSDTPETSTSFQEIDFSTQDYAETVTRYESVRTVVLHESRRMRSGELHYLDNPFFGVMVKVIPYEPADKIGDILP